MQAAIRNALVDVVKLPYEAAWPDVPIAYPNAPFDRNNLPALWGEFEIKFVDGDQVGIAANPKTRYQGFVYITMWARAGTGTTKALLVLDWFTNQLKYGRVEPVTLQAPQPESPTGVAGWHLEQLKFYFYSDPG